MTRQEHLLTLLIEEAAEVQQRATKALRFGMQETQPGQQMTNQTRLMMEIFHLQCAMEMLGMAAPHQHPEGMNECPICDKATQVERFLDYSRTLGTLK